jgi:glycosyltransferase involved in cell wall biosynthesis
MAPFVWGGAEELALHLVRNLSLAGHDAKILRIPFRWEPATGILSQMLMAKSLSPCSADKVIALKFPAYLIDHPDKTIWLLHQYRQAYDLFDAGMSNIDSSRAGQHMRSLIRTADNECFSQARHIYTNSRTTSDRLKKYNGFDSEVLLPPVNDPELFTGGKPEGYIFAGGRINGLKRQHLLLEALAIAREGVRLVIAGPPDTPDDEARLRSLVERLGVGDRVHLDLRFLSRGELARYVNHASSCVYIPYDEDSLGYVAMEAAYAAKALITTSDSGGVLGLVKDGETGWVCDPAAESLAEAMSVASGCVKLALQRGDAARRLWLSMDVNWATTIKRLLS